MKCLLSVIDRGMLQLMIRSDIIASVMAFCRGWLTGYVVVWCTMNCDKDGCCRSLQCILDLRYLSYLHGLKKKKNNQGKL